MPVNASKRQLIQLIYRHLKEQGFHSTADELQRHSPQEETNICTSLSDIYNSWLKDSKKKRKPDSRSKEQGRTPAKGMTAFKKSSSTSVKDTPTAASRTDVAAPSVATLKKKKDKPAKKVETQKKKHVPAKKKKGEGKSAVTTKVKKLKPQAKSKVVAAGGNESDSDSSLDVEKWKKLLLQMTDADAAKMDTINSLDSSFPPPKKTRVRKPRAKPAQKTNAIIIQPNTETAENSEKVGEKVVTPTKNSKPKRSRPKKTAPATSSTVLSEEQNITPVEDPMTSPVSTSKQKPKKEKRKIVSPSEEKSEETTSEPKKKKKKKEVTEDEAEEDVKTALERKEKKKNKVTEEESGDKPAGKKKKAKGTKGDVDMNETEEKMENGIGNVDNDSISEQIVLEKKAKKKKKLKTASDENSEQTNENVKEDAQQISDEKKAKKKKRTLYTDDNSVLTNENVKEDTQQISEEKKTKKNKKRTLDTEDNSEQTNENVKEDTQQINK
ncbi:uncharacterized protein LKV04_004955 [Tautogolabrus adspersus]